MKLLLEVENESQKIILKEKDLINRTDELIIKSFNCLVCSNLVIDPVQCEKCNYLFCSKCILPEINEIQVNKADNTKDDIKNDNNEIINQTTNKDYDIINQTTNKNINENINQTTNKDHENTLVNEIQEKEEQDSINGEVKNSKILEDQSNLKIEDNENECKQITSKTESIIEQIKCPCCGDTPFISENINKHLGNILDNFKFNCPLLCGSKFKYTEKEMHVKECTIINCFVCNETVKKIDYADHMENCKRKPIYCNNTNIYLYSEFKQANEEFFKDLLLLYKKFFDDIKNTI